MILVERSGKIRRATDATQIARCAERSARPILRSSPAGAMDSNVAISLHRRGGVPIRPAQSRRDVILQPPAKYRDFIVRFPRISLPPAAFLMYAYDPVFARWPGRSVVSSPFNSARFGVRDMTTRQLPIGLLTLCLMVLAAVATPAMAYPDFGTSVDGNCFYCHSTIVYDRMELLDFAGVIDPFELPGIPDQGPLKYYSTPAGGHVGMTINAIDGTEVYAFQIIGFDDPDVTNGGTLTYEDDPAWLAYRGSFRTYFVRADGGFDGYDWGTGDPTRVTYDIHVNPSTPPGNYLLEFALVGRDAQHDRWYHSERFYLEVTQGSAGPSLTIDATCPGGGPIVISWSGATGGAPIALIFARNTGNFTIPNNNPCAGTPLGLGSNQIQLAYQGSAGANGSRTLNANAGPGACGGYFQLLDVATCTTSNVAEAQ